MTVTELKTTHIRADELRPGMVRVWRGLHSGKVVMTAEINGTEDSGRYVEVRYSANSTISRIRAGVEIEVLAEGYEF